MEIQKELLKKTYTSSTALEIAISIENGIRNQLNMRAEDSSMVSIVGRTEPVCLVNASSKGTFRQTWQGKNLHLRKRQAFVKIEDKSGLFNIVINVQMSSNQSRLHSVWAKEPFC